MLIVAWQAQVRQYAEFDKVIVFGIWNRARQVIEPALGIYDYTNDGLRRYQNYMTEQMGTEEQ